MAKKIGAIVSLSIIGVLIIATIIMANIKVNYSISCEKPQYVYVTVDGTERGAKPEQADEIVNLISGASKQSSLTALFNGEMGKEAKVVTEKGKVPTNATYLVRYHYASAQDLKEGNKIYKDGDGNSYKYTDLIFAVNDLDGEQEFRVYVIETTDLKSYTHYYLLDADFGALFDYLKANF